MNVFVLLISAVGLTFIISEGRFFARLREQVIKPLGNILHCPPCMGFWVGVAVEILVRTTAESSIAPTAHVVTAALLAGWATSGLTVVVIGLRRYS